MNRKQEFVNAVKLPAPNGPFVLQLAQSLPEAILPQTPVAAVAFVGAAKKQAASARLQARRENCRVSTSLSLGHALRVKSAEYWLMLGEPAQAMAELRRLPPAAKQHRPVIKALVAATRALREIGQCVTRF